MRPQTIEQLFSICDGADAVFRDGVDGTHFYITPPFNFEPVEKYNNYSIVGLRLLQNRACRSTWIGSICRGSLEALISFKNSP